MLAILYGKQHLGDVELAGKTASSSANLRIETTKVRATIIATSSSRHIRCGWAEVVMHFAYNSAGVLLRSLFRSNSRRTRGQLYDINNIGNQTVGLSTMTKNRDPFAKAN
jgi:hypothetical protein